MEAGSDPSLNTSKICRFCLSQAGVMSPIFEQGELNSLPLSSKIMAFISVQVYVNDGLPSLICHRCLYQVEKSYDFKTQCEASDAMLRKYLTAIQSNLQSKLPPSLDRIESTPTFDSFNVVQFQKSMLQSPVFNDSPFKRKRGRPRKEENLIFYGSPVHQHLETSNSLSNYADDDMKLVDGIESLVTVVDPRSEMMSNSDEENKLEIDLIGDGESEENGPLALNNDINVSNHNNINNTSSDNNDIDNNTNNNNDNANDNGISNNNNNLETPDSLAIAKAKGKKYMGIVIELDENGTRIRKHLCKGCGKTFGHCSDLRKHVLVHTGERPFQCHICSKTFSRSTNLNKHLKVHSGQKPFFCTTCPKAFATKGDLHRHLVTHSGLKPYGCKFCNQCFSRKDKLTRHLKLHTDSDAGKNFVCNYCSAVFLSKNDLGEHVESMHAADDEDDEDEARSILEEHNLGGQSDQRPIKEEDSSNDKDMLFKIENDQSSPDANFDGVESMVINIDPFQVDSDLSEAMNAWESEKDKTDLESLLPLNPDGELDLKPEIFGTECAYQCRVCNRKFSEISYLRSHMTTHSLFKPHKCSLCDKSFTRRRELLRHESVHTGFKPFKCPTCAKAFSRKDKLARHEKIHNGVKRFACQICLSVCFAKLEELIEHHGSVHSDDQVLADSLQCELCSARFPDWKVYEGHLRSHEVQNDQKSNYHNCNGDGFNSDEDK